MKRKKSFFTIAIAIMLILIFCVSGCTISTPTEETNQDVVQDETDGTDEDAEQKRQITILGSKSFYDAYIGQYVKSFTDIKFSLIESENGYALSAEELVPLLLSGDDTFDIYEVASTSLYTLSLLKEGYYVDLSAYPVLVDKFNHMYPVLSESSKIDGEIFGFPISIYTDIYLMYKQYYFDEVGWTTDQITTIDDMIEFSDVLTENGYKNKVIFSTYSLHAHTTYKYIYNNYDYDNHYIDLDNPEFYKVLEEAKKIYDTGIVYESGNFPQTNSSPALYASRPMTPYDKNYINFPQITEQNNSASAYISWYIINPYSKNIDEAVETLDILGEVYKLVAKTGFEVYNDVAYNRESTVDLTMFQDTWGISQERVDLMTARYDNHKCFFAFLNYNYLYEPFLLYLRGEIEAEEAVEELQQVIDTISAERSIDD